jgi:cation:H+ antiporter
MILLVVGFGVGLLLLVKASDYFVVGSARLATRLRVSPVFIGVAVIGFGTSAPELLVSGLAAAQGNTELAMGNVVGSNVANMTLVLGTAGLLAVVPVRSAVLRWEWPPCWLSRSSSVAGSASSTAWCCSACSWSRCGCCCGRLWRAKATW